MIGSSSSGRAAAGLVVALAVLAGAGCTQEASSEARQPRPAPPPHLVELAAVELDALRSVSVYTGSLRHRQRVRVFNQEEGRVIRLPPFEGDRVAAGDLLFELDAALLRAQLERARAVSREARANLDRTKRLVGRKMVSAEEHLRAVTALEVARAEETMLATRVGYARGVAPFDGVVAERLVEPGDVVPRHTHLLTLVDPASLVTDLRVSELVVPHLRAGDAVEVRIDALGDRVFAGRVLRVHPELDPRTRLGRVEIELQPVPEGARAGLFTRVVFRTEALDRKVMPFAALRRDRDGEYVFRVEADGVARRVGVRSGRRQAARVEVVEGLAIGDRVVVRGFLGLNDGKQVTAVGGSAGKPASG